MKNRIIKYGYSIIAFLLILLNGVEAKASTPWMVNPSDYRYDMSIYLKVAFADNMMDYSKYEVAVFSGEECRGIAERLILGDESECLYLRARSNQETEETLTFKYYNKDTEEILPIDGVSFVFESNSRLGYPSEPLEVKIIRHYDIILKSGDGGSLDNQGGRLAENTKLTVTAIPAEGFHFEQWSDGVTENPRIIVVNGDLTLSAVFTVNSYKLTYEVDGAEYKVYSVDYGTSITPEIFPEKEGHSFSGWQGLPETMPARDVTVTGTFTINSYNAVFKIGDEVIDTVNVVYGQPVTAPQAPEKEGHTFAGWQDVPESMPASDIEIHGSYTVNSYNLTYEVDGSEYKVYSVDYGTSITPEIFPEKEGHSFSGWQGLPETMPARDVTVTGTFTINSYNAVFKIGDEVIDTVNVVYGQPVTAPQAPEKEGHTFAGWQDVPESMPASDIEIYGNYTVNVYAVKYYVDGNEYLTDSIAYGEDIKPAPEPEKEGYEFSGWSDIPETMPAHDIIIEGSFKIASGIEKLMNDNNGYVTIYSINGVLIKRNILYQDIKEDIPDGLYIVNGKKIMIKR